MTRFSDDEKLIAFLKQYRPLPPSLATNLEDKLIQKIQQEPRLSNRKFPWLFWAIPSAIAASLLLVWGGSRWGQTSPQIAVNSHEIEGFIVETWEGSMEENSLNSSHATLLSDLLLMNDFQPNNNLPNRDAKFKPQNASLQIETNTR